MLDREIRSWPQIDPKEPTLSDGIGGGSAQIENIGNLGEAKDLALVLQTGAHPRLVLAGRANGRLGHARQGLSPGGEKAAIISLLVVALFLIIFYRLLGIVAVTGLAVYVAFMYAAILILNVTLTLLGFAGLILTIGVAADANVVIFERIKEEVRPESRREPRSQRVTRRASIRSSTRTSSRRSRRSCCSPSPPPR